LPRSVTARLVSLAFAPTATPGPSLAVIMLPSPPPVPPIWMFGRIVPVA
jgi:hypothetical protein